MKSKVATAIVFVAIGLLIGIAATTLFPRKAKADEPQTPLTSVTRFQFGPTLIYEWLGDGEGMIASHKNEPALGFQINYSPSDKWIITGTVARWFLPNGNAPVQNYAHIQATYLLFNQGKK